MKHGILLRRTLSCFLALMLFFSTGTAAFSEAAAPGEPDLDLTALSGTVLLNRLAEIQEDPDTYAGLLIRVRGQYYAAADPDGNLRRSLIVCDSCQCSEIGIQLSTDPESEFSWPEINSSVEILGEAEPYVTPAGIPSVRLSVLRVD